MGTLTVLPEHLVVCLLVPASRIEWQRNFAEDDLSVLLIAKEIRYLTILARVFVPHVSGPM